MSVCLSARIIRKTHDQTAPDVYSLPVSVAGSCDGVAIRYVLPVVWSVDGVIFSRASRKLRDATQVVTFLSVRDKKCQGTKR